MEQNIHSNAQKRLFDVIARIEMQYNANESSSESYEEDNADNAYTEIGLNHHIMNECIIKKKDHNKNICITENANYKKWEESDDMSDSGSTQTSPVLSLRIAQSHMKMK